MERFAYWIALGFACAFWLLAAYVCAMMLSMSALGRLHGGAVINAAATVYVLVWLSGVTAFVVALWKWRKVGRAVQLAQLARMSRPSDPAEASVWRWMKVAWWAWLFVLAFLTCTLIAGMLGLI